MCRGTNLEAHSVVCLLFLRSTCLFLAVPIKRFLCAATLLINYTIKAPFLLLAVDGKFTRSEFLRFMFCHRN